ncbi:MAG: SCE4755 family polysaccharide monooxygenase-like protein [Vicinamibacterales bacterium]
MKRTILVFASLLLVVPAVARAHFKLLEPASWLVEDDRGDPQKGGPCGGSNTDFGKPSYIIGKVVGGSKLHIKVQETIYHPGHYRVALAVNSPLELPLDPVAAVIQTPQGPRSISGTINVPPQPPVLADGLFYHQTRATAPFETDVTLPNISCPKCTLQVVQFMDQHAFNNPGGYTYHHCADLQITADPNKPRDTGWPALRQ